MIELSNISKHYEGKRILENLSFTFNKGFIYYLNGSNGVGKTTLLNILYNLTKPTCGSYRFNGTLVKPSNQSIKSKIGFFHTNGKYLIDYFTVNEYIDFYLDIKLNIKGDKLSIKTKLVDMLRQLNFNSSLDEKIDKMSTGTKMKISIACVLVGNFDLVLLDEPFANLDSNTCKTLMEIINEIKQNKHTTFIISSHNLLLDANYYDFNVALKDHKLSLLETSVDNILKTGLKQELKA